MRHSVKITVEGIGGSGIHNLSHFLKMKLEDSQLFKLIKFEDNELTYEEFIENYFHRSTSFYHLCQDIDVLIETKQLPIEEKDVKILAYEEGKKIITKENNSKLIKIKLALAPLLIRQKDLSEERQIMSNLDYHNGGLAWEKKYRAEYNSISGQVVAYQKVLEIFQS